MVDFNKALNKSRGYDYFNEREQQIEEERKNNIPRFWLPGDTATKVVFLDDNPPIIEEHQLKIGGDWKNWFTCLKVIDEPCPICNILRDNSYTVGFYTIIDTAKFKDRQGNERQNVKKVLPAKFKTLKQLRRLSKNRGGLKYCVFDVYRTDNNSVNVGDVWDFVGELSEEEVKKLNEDISPVNYAEYLEPKSPADLKAILQGNAENGGGNNDSGHDYDDEPDVPF